MAKGVYHKKFDGVPIPDVDKQHKWITEYSIKPIELGMMCEKFPGLQKSWEQFKITYNLCKSAK
jgi:hypothetical protein